MSSFLQKSAEHLIEKIDIPNKLCVVLPTRRSVVVLSRLFQNLNPDFQPYLFAIEDFIPHISGRKVTGYISLLIELYDTFREIEPDTQLDRFTSWGYVLLKDFDQIDKNLIEPKKLFTLLNDIQTINRWGLEEDKITDKVQKYFVLWENLEKTYENFRQKLEKNNQAYEGMLYRKLAENVEQYFIQNTNYEQYAFVGFNALSKAEEKIIRTLIKHKKAITIWDSDTFYTHSEHDNQAGIYLKEYKKTWASGEKFLEGKELLEDKKSIEVVSVGNSSMQGKVANQFLKNWQFSERVAQNPDLKTVIVLADENLLSPVLHSLSPVYEGLNITLGVSLRNSALFHFINQCFLLHQNQRRIRNKETEQWELKFHYQDLIKIFSHNFVKKYELSHLPPSEDIPDLREKSLLQVLIQYINTEHLFYQTEAEIRAFVLQTTFQERKSEAEIAYYLEAYNRLKPLFDLLLSPWKRVQTLMQFFQNSIEMFSPFAQSLDQEYFEQFREILSDFETTFQQLKSDKRKLYNKINIPAFRTFLYQAFRQETVAFDSDRENPLQIMGLLETRTLDFENVIVLSVNEKTLPKSKKHNSFIPFDIAKELGLPTYREQDAVMSYHFYRLLQRVKNIGLVYVSPSDTYGAEEKSRLIHQLEFDLAKLNPNITFKELSASLINDQTQAPLELKIPKSEAVLKKIKEKLRKGISPVHINAFIDCPLKYYFSQVAELKEVYQADEDLGADKFGTIVHEILEETYRELAEADGKVYKEGLESVIEKIPEVVTSKFQKAEYKNYRLTGSNYITKEVAVEFIQRFLKKQIEEIETAGMPFEIIMLEGESTEEEAQEFKPQLGAVFQMNLGEEKIRIKVSGIIDRVDRIGNKTRVIDYKTGKAEAKDLKIKSDELNRLVEDKQLSRLRQLWIYQYILSKRIVRKGTLELGNYTLDEGENLEAGIYTFRNIDAGLIKFTEQTDKGKSPSLIGGSLKNFVKVSENYLQQIFSNMLDTSQDFEKTKDLDTCEYCSYSDICGR